MKWYNYKEYWINMELCSHIYIWPDTPGISLWSIDNSADSTKWEYSSFEERDAEFEKIKALMGVKDFTSRCC